MALTFFKIPKNKKFNYRPVYYDKKKEEREEREKTISDDDPEHYASALRDRLNLRWKRTAGARSRKASNQRLIIILVVMFMLLYLIFYL
ncbi:MAG: hypothetical protein RG741_00775 [Bacteroidales bacterium]|nr:hypothetical protein [Bacteroidales bacterium]